MTVKETVLCWIHLRWLLSLENKRLVNTRSITYSLLVCTCTSIILVLWKFADILLLVCVCTSIILVLWKFADGLQLTWASKPDHFSKNLFLHQLYNSFYFHFCSHFCFHFCRRWMSMPSPDLETTMRIHSSAASKKILSLLYSKSAVMAAGQNLRSTRKLFSLTKSYFIGM